MKALAIGGVADHVHMMVHYQQRSRWPKPCSFSKAILPSGFTRHFPNYAHPNGKKATAHSPSEFPVLMQRSRISETKPSIIAREHFAKNLWRCYSDMGSIKMTGCWIDSFVPTGTRVFVNRYPHR
ncbi:MAG: hypothetical protein WBX14_09400 [Candidatus Udaeobacter sp.]